MLQISQMLTDFVVQHKNITLVNITTYLIKNVFNQ